MCLNAFNIVVSTDLLDEEKRFKEKRTPLKEHLKVNGPPHTKTAKWMTARRRCVKEKQGLKSKKCVSTHNEMRRSRHRHQSNIILIRIRSIFWFKAAVGIHVKNKLNKCELFERGHSWWQHSSSTELLASFSLLLGLFMWHLKYQVVSVSGQPSAGWGWQQTEPVCVGGAGFSGGSVREEDAV